MVQVDVEEGSICTCGKVVYLSHGAAHQAIRKMWKQTRRLKKRVPDTIYECAPGTGIWHLTSGRSVGSSQSATRFKASIRLCRG